MWRSVRRTTGMPRPAKPARQTRYAHKGIALDEHAGTPAKGSGMHAYLACRAGFAGRGIPVARPTDATASRPTPTQDAVLGRHF